MIKHLLNKTETCPDPLNDRIKCVSFALTYKRLEKEAPGLSYPLRGGRGRRRLLFRGPSEIMMTPQLLDRFVFWRWCGGRYTVCLNLVMVILIAVHTPEESSKGEGEVSDENFLGAPVCSTPLNRKHNMRFIVIKCNN